MLAAAVKEPLRRHLDRVRRLHERDVKAGFGRVHLPQALARKYPNADREWGWQWVFPASRLCTDPRFGPPQRYHLHESVPQRAIRAAAQKAGLAKPVRLEPIGVGIGIGIEHDLSFGDERPDVYRAAIEYVGWVHRATDRFRCRYRFRPRGELAAREMPNKTLHQPGTTGPSGQAGSVPVRRRLVSFGVRLPPLPYRGEMTTHPVGQLVFTHPMIGYRQHHRDHFGIGGLQLIAV